MHYRKGCIAADHFADREMLKEEIQQHPKMLPREVAA